MGFPGEGPAWDDEEWSFDQAAGEQEEDAAPQQPTAPDGEGPPSPGIEAGFAFADDAAAEAGVQAVPPRAPCTAPERHEAGGRPEELLQDVAGQDTGKRAAAPGEEGGSWLECGEAWVHGHPEGDTPGIVETVNRGGWGPVSERIRAAKPEVCIVLVQEHKLRGEAMDAAAAGARALGWHGAWAPAVEGPGGGPSGGVAVLARTTLGVKHCRVVVPGRLAAATIEMADGSELVGVSLYGVAGIGPRDENLLLLAAAGRAIADARAAGCETLIGGDWNMSPAQVARTGWPVEAGVRLVFSAAGVPSCRPPRPQKARHLDFFAASHRLLPALGSCTVDTSEIPTPHRPVQLRLPPRLSEVTAQVLVAPKPYPVERVVGPLPDPPNYADAVEAVARARRVAIDARGSVRDVTRALHVAGALWDKGARKELDAITGLRPGECAGGAPRLAWRKVAPPQPKGELFARAKRARAAVWLACAADDVRAAATDDPEALGNLAGELAMAAAGAESELGGPREAEESAGAILSNIATAAASGDVAGARSQCDELVRIAAAVAGPDGGLAELAAARSARWRDWAKAGVEGGARQGHRWTKTPEPWCPPPIVTRGERETARPAAVAEAKAAEFGALWEAGPAPVTSKLPPRKERWALDRADPETMRAAARSFPKATAVGTDGMRPGHFQWMSDQCLEVLASIWEVMEICGLVPGGWRHLKVPLIPKKGAKLRAIGLFVAPVRLWSKVRRSACEEWEAANDRAYFAAGTGRSPLDPVWRASARAEGSVGEGDVAASVLADIGTFFDRMPHEVLRRAAKTWGFPLPLLEVALHLYTGARYVEWGRASAPPVFATRGVVAGCSLCTTLAKLILLSPMDAVVGAHRQVSFDVFVDDLRAGTAGTPDVVTRRLDAAFADAEIAFAADGVPLVAHKTTVAATNGALAKRVRRAVGVEGPGGEPEARAEFLGADFAPGARRGSWVAKSKRRKRFRTALARKGRLMKLRKAAGPKAAVVATAGILPQASFAAEVTGLTDGEVTTLRRATANAIDGGCGGRSAGRLLLLAGNATARIEVAPAARWAQEVWAMSNGDQRALSGGTLNSIFAAVAAKPPKRWQDVRGPAGATWLTLRRLGWSWPGPWEFRDDRGRTFHLAKAAPRLVALALRNAVKADLERQAAGAFGGKGYSHAGQRVSLDVVARELRSSTLGTREKSGLRAIVSGALWTRARLQQAGYPVDPTCPLCGKDTDTMWHRMWQCAGTADLRRADPALTERALAAGPGSLVYSMAVVPHPATRTGYAGPSLGPEVRHWGWPSGVAPRFPPGEVFLDGSCTPSPLPELARASWAVVQLCPRGSVLRSVLGLVPAHLPQSAPAAEHCALEAAAATCDVGCVPFGDCKMVVDSARRGHDPAGWSKAVFGGSIRAALQHAGAGALLRATRKVKAHQSLIGLEGPELCLAIGNDRADAAAKQAISGHPQSDPAEAAVMARWVEDAQAVAKLAGRTAARGPPTCGPDRRRDRRRDARASAAAGAAKRRAATVVARAGRAAVLRANCATHWWATLRGVTRCGRCLDRRTAGIGPCRGAPGDLEARAIAARVAGHAVWHCLAVPPPRVGPPGASVPFIACSRCGAWESAGSSSLMASACLPPSRSGAAAVARLLRGLFPRASAQWRGFEVTAMAPWPAPGPVGAAEGTAEAGAVAADPPVVAGG